MRAAVGDTELVGQVVQRGSRAIEKLANRRGPVEDGDVLFDMRAVADRLRLDAVVPLVSHHTVGVVRLPKALDEIADFIEPFACPMELGEGTS